MEIKGQTPWYRNKWFNFGVVALVAVYTLWSLISLDNPVQSLGILRNMNLWYLSVALLSMLLYVLLEALMMHLLILIHTKKAKVEIAIKSTIIGQYYSMITPFASGGQPMQLISMIDDGIESAHATAVLVNKFVYFQVGVAVYAFVLSLLNMSKIWSYIQQSYGILAVGLLVNFIGLLVLALMIFNPRGLKRLSLIVYQQFQEVFFGRKSHVLCQRKWFRKIDATTSATQKMLGNRELMLRMIILTALQLTAYFGITYFIYRSFGLTGHGFVEIVTLQAVLHLSISLLPTPGSSGVAETGFKWFFASLFTSGSLLGAIVIWRGISYYLNLLFSGVLTLYFNIKSMKRHDKLLRSL